MKHAVLSIIYILLSFLFIHMAADNQSLSLGNELSASLTVCRQSPIKHMTAATACNNKVSFRHIAIPNYILQSSLKKLLYVADGTNQFIPSLL